MYLFVTHCLVLKTLSVQERARPDEALDSELQTALCDGFLPPLFAILESAVRTTKCQTYVDIDGRVFVALLHYALYEPDKSIPDLVGPDVAVEVSQIWEASGRGIEPPVDIPLLRHDYLAKSPKIDGVRKRSQGEQSEAEFSLLPFNNPVFDEELSAVQVSVTSRTTTSLITEASASANTELTFGTLFSDTRHWHANKRSILPKHLGGDTSREKDLDARARFWRLKNEQFAMARLQRLAGTLTGASGALLEQIVITSANPSEGKKDKAAKKREDKANERKAVVRVGDFLYLSMILTLIGLSTFRPPRNLRLRRKLQKNLPPTESVVNTPKQNKPNKNLLPSSGGPNNSVSSRPFPHTKPNNRTCVGSGGMISSSRDGSVSNPGCSTLTLS